MATAKSMLSGLPRFAEGGEAEKEVPEPFDVFEKYDLDRSGFDKYFSGGRGLEGLGDTRKFAHTKAVIKTPGGVPIMFYNPSATGNDYLHSKGNQFESNGMTLENADAARAFLRVMEQYNKNTGNAYTRDKQNIELQFTGPDTFNLVVDKKNLGSFSGSKDGMVDAASSMVNYLSDTYKTPTFSQPYQAYKKLEDVTQNVPENEYRQLAESTLRFISGLDSNADSSWMDVNKDGKVDMADSNVFLQYANKPRNVPVDIYNLTPSVREENRRKEEERKYLEDLRKQEQERLAAAAKISVAPVAPPPPAAPAPAPVAAPAPEPPPKNFWVLDPKTGSVRPVNEPAPTPAPVLEPIAPPVSVPAPAPLPTPEPPAANLTPTPAPVAPPPAAAAFQPITYRPPITGGPFDSQSIPVSAPVQPTQAPTPRPGPAVYPGVTPGSFFETAPAPIAASVPSFAELSVPQNVNLTPRGTDLSMGYVDRLGNTIAAPNLNPYGFEAMPVFGYKDGGEVDAFIRSTLAKKFADGGPAGSPSSGVRRLKMSGYQEGGDVSNDAFIQEMMTGTPASDEKLQSVGEYLKGAYKENIPVHARVYLETLLGKKGPVTAEDFTKEELADIEKLLASKPAKGAVTKYAEYEKVRDLDRTGRVPGDWMENLPSVGKTLGRFTYETLPDGKRVITDNYDFYNTSRALDVQEFEGMKPAEKALAVLKKITADRSVMDPPFLKRAADILGEAYIGRDGRPVKVEYDPKDLPVKRQAGSPSQGEISDDAAMMEMFTGTLPEAQGPSPVDTAVSDFISSRSKLVTDPQEFFRVMGENIETYHGKPLREDPEKYLMEQLGPGALAGVIKLPGGNYLAGQVEKALKETKTLTTGAAGKSPENVLEEMKATYPPEVIKTLSPESVAQVNRSFADLEPKVALNKWIDSKLTKYVKNDMATERDPLRLQADKWATEQQPKLLAEKDAQIAKARADMERAQQERGVEPEMLTRSRARLLELEKERDFIAARTGLHYVPQQTPQLYSGGVNLARENKGFPSSAVAKSEAGKLWEDLSDRLFLTDTTVGDITAPNYFLSETYAKGIMAENPWLFKVSPETEIQLLNRGIDQGDTGFKHMTDELRNALNPESGLPPSLQISPKDLEKMTVPQAADLVDRINAHRAVQKAEANALAAQKSTEVYKEYPGTEEGLRWVEMKIPNMPEDFKLPEGYKVVKDDRAQMQETPWFVRGPHGDIIVGEKGLFFADPEEALKNATQGVYREGAYGELESALKYEGDIMQHCVGGYCPDVVEGRSRIFSLRDNTGKPAVTVEVKPSNQMGPSDFYHSDAVPESLLKKIDEAEAAGKLDNVGEFEEFVRNSSEFKAYKENSPLMVTQIKGVKNLQPDEKYLPFVHDFLKTQKWTSIGDLKNAGLVQLKPMLLKNAQDRGLNPQVITTVGDQPYITKEEFNRLADLFGGMNKYAAGGEVTNFIKRQAGSPPQGEVSNDEFIKSLGDRSRSDLATIKEAIAEIGKNKDKYAFLESKGFTPTDIEDPVKNAAYGLFLTSKTSEDPQRFLSTLSPFYDSKIEFDYTTDRSTLGEVQPYSTEARVYTTGDRGVALHELVHTLQMRRAKDIAEGKKEINQPMSRTVGDKVFQRAADLAKKGEITFPATNWKQDKGELMANVYDMSRKYEEAGKDFTKSIEFKKLFPDEESRLYYYTQTLPDTSVVYPAGSSFEPLKTRDKSKSYARQLLGFAAGGEITKFIKDNR